MKKTAILCLMLALSLSAMALSKSKVRTYARFLTDRMAYELDLTPMQYDDCYEINYDFIYYASRVMNDVVYGYIDAIDRYYTYLDYRNEDLRYVLTSSQYVRFLAREYFYRPIYSTGSGWALRVYTIYSNRSFYYFDAPKIFRSYRGDHARAYYNNSYYMNRYSNRDRFTGSFRITGSTDMHERRKSDFGTNLKQRGGVTYNNYKNPTANNRTQDSRYRDNSGNTHSPQINHRSPNDPSQPATVTPGRGNSSSQPATVTPGRGSSSSRSTTTTTPSSSSRSTTATPSRSSETKTTPTTSGNSQRSGQNTGTRGGRR
ncbi:MAG: hypothetical protein K5945_08235 [Bacteroidaceae bacterium]|nr:hypothetical protein [Bacteroidaceae bacterium]